MKKLAFLVAILAAGSVFAADFTNKTNSEIVGSIEGTSPKNLADAAFEIRKRASASMKEFGDICGDFNNMMQNEMRSKTKEERATFKDQFHKELNSKVATLSTQEKANFDFGVCSKFLKNVKHDKAHHGNHKNEKK